MTTAIEPSADEIERVKKAALAAYHNNQGWTDIALAAILAMDRRAEAVGEPVAMIGRDWRLLWYSPDGIETLSKISERTGAQVGDKLYRASPPAPAVAVPEGRDVMLDLMGALAAAISLLERYPKAKQAAPSNKMFDQMLIDYRASLDRARQYLAAAPQPPATRSYEEGIEAAARIVEGQPYGEGADNPARYRTWAHWPTLPNGTKGNRGVDDFLVKHCDALATAIRSLADEPRHGE